MRIGLDIDGVLADFVGGFLREAQLAGMGDRFPKSAEEWVFHHPPDREAFDEIWEQIEGDRSFWLGLSPLMRPSDIPFEPALYCTARPIATEVTQAWLFAHGFPPSPVSTVPYGHSKLHSLKTNKIEAFVDDNLGNYDEITKGGIVCYLWDTPANRHRTEGGLKRIFGLAGVALGPRSA